MSILWKIGGVVLLVLTAVVMSPLILVTGIGDLKRYMRIRSM
ncbi:MAG: hypothetical protein ACRETC_02195 [Gammaproteobacteria bacterium]